MSVKILYGRPLTNLMRLLSITLVAKSTLLILWQRNTSPEKCFTHSMIGYVSLLVVVVWGWGLVPALGGSLEYWTVTKTDERQTMHLISLEAPIDRTVVFVPPFWIYQLHINENIVTSIHSSCIPECIEPTPSSIVRTDLSQKGVQKRHFLCHQKWHFSRHVSLANSLPMKNKVGISSKLFSLVGRWALLLKAAFLQYRLVWAWCKGLIQPRSQRRNI